MKKALTVIFILCSLGGYSQIISIIDSSSNLWAINQNTAARSKITNQNTTGTAGGLSADIAQSRVTNLESDLAAKSPIANAAHTGTLTTTGSLGYATGAGGTVTQATNKTTAVTLNKISGQITMNGAALAAAAEVAFTLTNSTIAATDVVIINVQSVGTAGAYLVSVGAVAAGSCSITVSNASAGSLSQAIILNFAVIKSVNN